MNQVDWTKVRKLSPNEFSENPRHAKPLLIYSLDEARLVMNKPMYPSKVPGALARFTGRSTTQHYATDRLSTACDVFCEGYPIFNFLTILSTTLFNGIGIYLDTNGNDGLPWIMFHLDIRKRGFDDDSPLIWIVEKVYDIEQDKFINKYSYPQRESKYWKLLQDGRLYENKKFRIGSSSEVG